MPNPLRANRGPVDGYRNRPMTRREANSLAIDAGLLMSDRDDRGRPSRERRGSS
jgi:hypothetical protein